MSFRDSLLAWMTTSSSILGAAVGSPTLAAIASGQVTWQQGIFPLAGSLMAIAMPQKTPPVPNAPPIGPIPLPSLASQIATYIKQVEEITQQAAKLGVMFQVPNANRVLTYTQDAATALNLASQQALQMGGLSPAPAPVSNPPTQAVYVPTGAPGVLNNA